MLEGFLFYYNFVSADSCGFARRGGRFPSSRSSPPATGGRAVADSRFRRAFAEGEQLVSLPSATDV